MVMVSVRKFGRDAEARWLLAYALPPKDGFVGGCVVVPRSPASIAAARAWLQALAEGDSVVRAGDVDRLLGLEVEEGGCRE